MLQQEAAYAPPRALTVEGGLISHRIARSLLLVAADVWMLSLSVAVSYLIWAAPIHQQSPLMYAELAPLVLLFVFGYSRAGLYPGLGLGPIETLRRSTFVTTFGFLILASFSFALKLPHLYSRVTFLLAFVLSLALVPLGRAAVFKLATRWSWWAEPVVVIGTGRRASRVLRDLKSAGHLGYRPAGVLAVDPRPGLETLEGIQVVGGLERVEEVADRGIRVAFLEIDQPETRPLLDYLQQSFQHVILLHEFENSPVEGIQVRNLGSLVGIEYTNNLLRPGNQALKRAMDLVLGSLGLFLVLPVIACAAALVRLVDGKPVFFTQARAGRGGRRISVPKIRTMKCDSDATLEDYLSANPAARAEWQSRQKLVEDPRLIPKLGRFFRRFSLDELPQFWSVIIGDMSLVGPRPFPDYHLARFTPGFRELRARVRPGITGLWQITVRSQGGVKEQEAFDSYYIRNWSVWFDLYIVGRTISAVASGRGAY